MQTVSVQAGRVAGSLQAPTSKSFMQRVVAAAVANKQYVTIRNFGTSNDDVAAMNIATQLGAIITPINDTTISINASNATVHQPTQIHCGESGLGIRMFTPIMCLYQHPVEIHGTGSLVGRPMHFFDEVLPQVGVSYSSQNGYVPLQVKGPLMPANITIDGSLSSQFLTGLLYGYSVAINSAAQPTEAVITVQNLASKPYIDLTLAVMQQMGMLVPTHHNYEQFVFNNAKPAVLPSKVDITVEGDWSGAAFLLVAGAIAGEVCLQGLQAFSTQADKAVLQAIMQTGATLSIEENTTTVKTVSNLQPFHFNATHCPDLFPPLAVLAAFCQGKSVIEGVGRLAHKESNRGLTLQRQLGAMGVSITLQDDLMIIDGGRALTGATVSSEHDHRIAMACAVAALKASGTTTITDADAINKSYPNFYQHIKALGAVISPL
ncbi:MAG: 3-phosphoshikimate 1-carboxyvinyltransferase [Bacteroidetes bacterium]|nr:MAG: 3-phosphoshikimate 1-carboxyvinyltransferase [Bacteroidota bacterium]TAF90998.1 MAG: 3-phosphoshikimate 1-carboxyvinyltransferase [Bacteroidota bacterium]